MKSTCIKCARDFFCGAASRLKKCWCFNEECADIDKNFTSCLCDHCLSKGIKRENKKRCFRLFIAYKGNNYCGFALQKNGPTIEGEIKKAFKKITDEDVPIVVAGRTDSSVHAHGQVASIELITHLTSYNLTQALLSFLPKDIAIWRIDEMPLGFNARFHSIGKQYLYTIDQSFIPSVFHKETALHIRKELDVIAMKEAANYLVGEHDFSSFRAKGCTAMHAIRYIWYTDVIKTPPFITIDIRGNAFLLNMVRIIVGTLVEVGLKKLNPIDLKDILAARDRTRAKKTAKALGLALNKVYYPDDLSEAKIKSGTKFKRYPVTAETWPFIDAK